MGCVFGGLCGKERTCPCLRLSSFNRKPKLEEKKCIGIKQDVRQTYWMRLAILSMASMASFGSIFLSNVKRVPWITPLLISEGLEKIIRTRLFFLSGSTFKSSLDVIKFMITMLSSAFESSFTARLPPSHDTPVTSLPMSPLVFFLRSTFKELSSTTLVRTI